MPLPSLRCVPSLSVLSSQFFEVQPNYERLLIARNSCLHSLIDFELCCKCGSIAANIHLISYGASDFCRVPADGQCSILKLLLTCFDSLHRSVWSSNSICAFLALIVGLHGIHYFQIMKNFTL